MGQPRFKLRLTVSPNGFFEAILDALDALDFKVGFVCFVHGVKVAEFWFLVKAFVGQDSRKPRKGTYCPAPIAYLAIGAN